MHGTVELIVLLSNVVCIYERARHMQMWCANECKNINNKWQDFCNTCSVLSNQTTGHNPTNEHKDCVKTGCLSFCATPVQNEAVWKPEVILHIVTIPRSINTSEDLIFVFLVL